MSRTPTFGQLLRGNLRVLGVVAVLAALAWGVWRTLHWLLPEVGWLGPGD